MVQIKEYAPSSAKLKMLIYGKSGTGKTTFGATAPKVLFVSSEAGLLSVADKKIQYASIKTLQDLRDVYALLRGGKSGFETVVIDSLTDIQNHIISQITGGKRMPQKGEWSDFGFELNKILRDFRDLDMHVIFLALETDKEIEDEKMMYMPDLYGSVRDKAAGYMDYVGRLALWSVTDENSAKQSKRGICFIYNERFIAKARRGSFDSITEPDFAAILKVATIEVSEEKVMQDVPTAESEEKKVAQPTVTAIFPAEPGDKMRSNEQSEEMMSLWDTLMAWLKVDETKRESMREKTLLKYCGVKSWNMLREKQAAAFIEKLKEQIADAKKKAEEEGGGEVTQQSEGVGPNNDTGTGVVEVPDSAKAKSPEEAAAHSARETEEDRAAYDVHADLKRRDELNSMSREGVEDVAASHEIGFTTKTTKAQLIDEIIKVEMPNAPIAKK